MATLASLNIALTADSARLKRDLDKAKGNTKKWASGQKKEFAAVAASVKLIGAAIAGISVTAFLRSATQVSQELRIMSNLTGVSTDELQRVTPSLVRAGISLEKYADIVKDVNDKMHDFMQTGGGPMRDFFEQVAPLVGITADAFKDLSGADALELYVSSLEKAGLSTEQMTFYMEALASDSTMLLPLLRNNAAGMDEFALAANEALTPETIASLDDMGVAFRTLGTVVFNMTLNTLEPLVEVIGDTISGFRQLVSDFPAILNGILVITAGVTALTLAMWANPVTIWAASLAAIVTGVALAYNKFKELSEAVGGAGELWRLLKEAAQFELGRIGLLITKLKLQMQLAFNEIGDKWASVLEKMMRELATFIDSVATSRFGVMIGMEGGNEDAALASSAAAMGERTDEFLRLSGELTSVREQLSASNPFLAQLTAAANASDPMSVEVTNLPDPTDLTGGGSGGGGRVPQQAETPEVANFYQTTAEQFVSGLKSAFSTALATGDWKSFLGSVVDTFTMGVINSFTEGLFAPMQEAMTGFIKGLMENIGGLGGGLFGNAGGFLSGLGSIFGFSEGGIVPTTSTSRSYADSVPAMLQPGELVVPKSQVDNFMSGAGGGGGQVFNVNVTGDVSRLTRAEIVRMLPEIAAGTNMINRENGGR